MSTKKVPRRYANVVAAVAVGADEDQHAAPADRTKEEHFTSPHVTARDAAKAKSLRAWGS